MRSSLGPDQFYKDDYGKLPCHARLELPAGNEKSDPGAKARRASCGDMALAIEEGDLANAAEGRRLQDQLMVRSSAARRMKKSVH